MEGNQYEILQHGNVIEESNKLVDNICILLSVPREALPDENSINTSLSSLPKLLSQINHRFIDENIVKLCVAISVGLYDDAIVRIWNSVIKEIRNKISLYGIEMIKHVAKEKYKDNFLETMTDSSLLTLARQLNIITREGYYYLDQCRDIRNNASIAHPTDIDIDEYELLTFINRCIKYGLLDDYETKGLDMKLFIEIMKNDASSSDQLNILAGNIAQTFDSQIELVWNILYSTATNENEPTSIRTNSIIIAQSLSHQISLPDNIEAEFIEKHNQYRLKGQDSSLSLSYTFLEKINRINNIDSSEKIALINKAIKNLLTTHNEFNNFYNEPPFAERLNQLFNSITPLPELIINNLVSVVLQCYLGNDYGVSTSAEDYYINILTKLSPKGTEVLLKLPREDDSFREQVQRNDRKHKRYTDLLKLLKRESLTTRQQHIYDEYLFERI